MLFGPALSIPSAQPFLPRHPGSQQKPVYLLPPGRRAVCVPTEQGQSYTVQHLSASQLSHLPEALGSGAVERPISSYVVVLPSCRSTLDKVTLYSFRALSKMLPFCLFI